MLTKALHRYQYDVMCSSDAVSAILYSVMIVCCVLGLKVHKTCRSETRASEIAYNIARGIEGSSKTTVGKYLTGSFNLVIFDLLIYLCFYYLDLVIFVKQIMMEKNPQQKISITKYFLYREKHSFITSIWIHNCHCDLGSRWFQVSKITDFSKFLPSGKAYP